MGEHLHRIPVRFGDCDPAGIAYYPRIFDWFHQAMESWFGAELGLPYAELITGRGLGMPSVHAEADFVAPCRLGDLVDVVLRVGKVGGSSVELDLEIRGTDGEVRALGRVVVVLIDLDGLSPVALPPDLRARIEAFSAA